MHRGQESRSPAHRAGPMMMREEILAVYAAGPEAVVRLVESLAQRLEEHEVRLQELEHRLRKDSHNSHKPPSSDSLSRGKKPKSLRGKSGKRSGGQPGHPGTTLSPVEKPNERRLYAPNACAHCGGSLEAVFTDQGAEAVIQGSISDVDRRARAVLREMGMTLTAAEYDDNAREREYHATSGDRTAHVELEWRTATTTEVDVSYRIGATNYEKGQARDIITRIQRHR